MEKKRSGHLEPSASQTSASTSTAETAPEHRPGGSVRILRILRNLLRPLLRFPRSLLLSLGIGLIVVAVALATLDLRYYGRLPLWQRAAVDGIFKKPFELNPDRQLPIFSNVTINAVAIAPADGNHPRRFFIAGTGDLLAFSDDNGFSWNRLSYDSARNCFSVPGQTCPVVAAGGGGSANFISASALPNLLAIRLTADGQGSLISSEPAFFSTHDRGQTWSKADRISPSIFAPTGKCPIMPGQTSLTKLLSSDIVQSSSLTFKTPPIPPYTYGCFSGLTPQVYAQWESQYSFGQIRSFDQNGAITSSFSVSPSSGFNSMIESLWYTSTRAWAAGQEYPVSGSAQPLVRNHGLLLQRLSSISDWTPHKQSFPVALRAVTFDTDGRVGLLSGDNGALFASGDAGDTWVPITYGAAEKYGAPPSWLQRQSWIPSKAVYAILWPVEQTWRLPPWWFYLLVFFGLIYLTAGLLPSPLPQLPVGFNSSSAGDVPVTRPDGDRLNFAPIIRGLSGLIRNRDTALPLTVGINGSWGSGKTSLMNLVRADVWDAGLRTIWFNAWHHQEEPNLLAALLQTIRSAAPPDLLEPGGFSYRAKLLTERFLRRPWHTLLIFVLVAGIAATHLHVRTLHPRVYLDAALELKCAVKPFSEPVRTAPNETSAAARGSAASPAKDRSLLEQVADILIRLTGGNEYDAAAPCGPVPNPPLPISKPQDSSAPSVFVFLALLLVLWPKLNELFKSFGANPAELLITRSSGSKLSELESQTNFRDKFKKQYGDVTHALAPRRLVIFIDDLDRCRPDKIGEMLEAVNYVIVAGPCVVVLGMEEEAVRAGLGLSFRELAKEITLTPVPSPAPNPQTSPSDSPNRAARQSFAARYMKKLLNVVIQVPVLTEEQYFQLISERADAPQSPQEIRDQKLSAYGRRAQFCLMALAAFTLSIVLGFLVAEFFGSYISASSSPQEATVATVPAAATGTAPVSETGNTSGVSTPAGQGAPSANPLMPVGPARFSPAAGALPGAWLSGTRGFVVAALLALLLGIIIARLFQSNPMETSDSPDLKEAFRIWSKVMAEITNTPREAKRLLNRIRYLALVDDPLPPDLPLWRRMFSSSAPKSSAPNAAPADHVSPETAEEGATSSATEHLPSPVLVALTVEQAALLASSQAGEERKKSLQEKLSQAWRDHRKAYPSDTVTRVNSFRERFSRIVQGVSTR